MKKIRLFIRNLRIFLAGFASTIPFVKVNISNYPFSKKYNQDDWNVVSEDLTLAIKNQIYNERKKK